MDGLADVLTVLGIFVLRIGVPLAITLLVGYLFSRLDARWEAEAEAQWQQEQAEKARAYWPQVQERARQTTLSAVTAGPLLTVKPPCWVLKANCSSEKCATCPAPRHPVLPCWLARQQAEGRLPAECFTCELFLPQPTENEQLMM